MTISLIIHSLLAAIWVGGMFFAFVILRPSVQDIEAPIRLTLWRGVFKRFFPWVWMSVLGLLATGYVMLFTGFGGFAGAGIHIHIMHLTGLIMAGLFFYLFHLPWLAFKRLVDQEDYPAAADKLGLIRKLVGANLALGLLTVAVGASGRYWG